MVSVQPAVLIGGKGKRFGGDKALLFVNGVPVLKRISAVLKKVFGREALFVGRESLPFPYKTVPDAFCGAGPIGGLFTALLASDTNFIFLTACDMPFISEKLLLHMKNTLRPESDIYIPRFKNGMVEPLFAFYSKRILRAVKEQIEKGDYKLHDLLNSASVQFIFQDEIERIDPELVTFFNINTKKDFEKAEKFSTGKPLWKNL